MSGELNTSAGNGWLNLTIFDYIVTVLKGGEWDGYVEGDDGIFASTVDVTTQDYANLGFDVKVEHHESVSTASFCGIIAAADGTLLKDPRRVFQKFGWTHSFISAGDQIMDQLLRAAALSLAYEAPQCPIIRALANKALELTRGVVPRFVPDGYHEPVLPEYKIPNYAPSAAARAAFHTKFGVSPSTQIWAERLIMEGRTDHLVSIFPPTQDMSHYVQAYCSSG